MTIWDDDDDDGDYDFDDDSDDKKAVQKKSLIIFASNINAMRDTRIL